MSSRNRSIAEEILDEINAVRKNPRSYIKPLENLSRQFKGNRLQRGGKKIQTKEGAKAVKDCINFLKRQKTVPTLRFSDELSKVCEELVDDIGPAGIEGDKGRDGLAIFERYEKHLTLPDTFDFVQEFGSDEPADIVMSLLVSDGDRSRNNRHVLFTTEASFCGIGFGNHKKTGHTTSILMSPEVIRKSGGKGKSGGERKTVVPKELELTEEDLEEVRSAFNNFKVDKNGRVDVKEIIRALDSLGSQKNEALYDIIKELDTPENNANGGITLEDLVSAIEHKLSSKSDKEQMKGLFTIFVEDPEVDGINEQMLIKVGNDIGENFTEDEVKEMLQYVAADKAEISFEDFYKIMTAKYTA